MVDSVSQVFSGGLALAEASAPPMTHKNHALNPDDTQAFSVLMDGKIPESMRPAEIGYVQAGEFQKTVATKGVELSQQVKALELEGRELMSADFADPLMQMKLMSDYSYRAAATFSQLHLTSSLASAANNSFHTLFKNQG